MTAASAEGGARSPPESRRLCNFVELYASPRWGWAYLEQATGHAATPSQKDGKVEHAAGTMHAPLGMPASFLIPPTLTPAVAHIEVWP
jgi:hypothetical protein